MKRNIYHKFFLLLILINIISIRLQAASKTINAIAPYIENYIILHQANQNYQVIPYIKENGEIIKYEHNKGKIIKYENNKKKEITLSKILLNKESKTDSIIKQLFTKHIKIFTKHIKTPIEINEANQLIKNFLISDILDATNISVLLSNNILIENAPTEVYILLLFSIFNELKSPFDIFNMIKIINSVYNTFQQEKINQNYNFKHRKSMLTILFLIITIYLHNIIDEITDIKIKEECKEYYNENNLLNKLKCLSQLMVSKIADTNQKENDLIAQSILSGHLTLEEFLEENSIEKTLSEVFMKTIKQSIIFYLLPGLNHILIHKNIFSLSLASRNRYFLEQKKLSRVFLSNYPSRQLSIKLSKLNHFINLFYNKEKKYIYNRQGLLNHTNLMFQIDHINLIEESNNIAYQKKLEASFLQRTHYTNI